MDEIEKQLKQYKTELEYMYAKANTKSKKKRIVDDLFVFSDMCHEKFMIEDDFSWEQDKNFNGIFNYDNSIFKGNVLEHKDIYLKISDCVIGDYVKSGFPLYKKDIDCYRDFHQLKSGQLFDLILSFLSDFDQNLLKIFEKKTDEGLIFKQLGESENSLGVTYQIASLKKNIMFASSNIDGNDTVRVAATVMHEFGHNYEMELYHNSGMKNRMQLYPFYEVSSQFFEYAFINYLLENKIYVEDAMLYQRIAFIELFYFMFGINLFSEMKRDDKNEYTLDLDDMKKKEIQIQERINYYGMSDFDFKEFDKCFIYGLGYLFSPYLYENYKQDPKMFMKEFKDALLTYPYTNSIEAFGKVGVTPEILMEGKILRKVLRDSR